MSAQVSSSLRGRHPDVLTCIANLSSDEVFTPPESEWQSVGALHPLGGRRIIRSDGSAAEGL